jgi:hypothetical protein
MNNQIVKLWVLDQIKKIQHKKNIGFVLPVVADAKIELLRDFYDDFNLDSVNFEIEYHAEI